MKHFWIFIIILSLIYLIIIIYSYRQKFLKCHLPNVQKGLSRDLVYLSTVILPNDLSNTNTNSFTFNLNSLNMAEPFNNLVSSENNNDISFKKIKCNKIYYGLPCKYIKDDCFYETLEKEGFVLSNDLKIASLIVPCSYEDSENEIKDLVNNGIDKNMFSDAVRIFMLNNTDYMVSKLALWKYLKEKYGAKVASGFIPYSWDLTDDNEVEIFKKEFSPDKLYITKNNHQRQEGLEIHNKLDTIINSRDKYLLVQELLQDPYLISGRKINLRVYVLVIKDNNSNIKILVYRDGFMYYTSELFEKGNNKFEKNITTGYIDRKIYEENPLTHMDLRKYLDSNREMTPIEQYIKDNYPKVKISEYVFSQIYELIAFVFQTYENIVGSKSKGVSFQVYGVDVAINDKLKPMIMEINKGPDLGAKDGRDRELKMNLARDILKSTGLLSNDSSNNFITVLENVNINGSLMPIHNLVEN